ncbi:uncharacterized protein STEHIDRAFT_138244 [Stereum hirsutum FP-91666 SS1]|uniref:uncharacterized protein n=1 Tax=Stereum hirsutum (strain FP-91666) TaxID=721885 RepID=UPI000440A4FE|nr:uncharacterized protein STEHIDRAFT_138244 [Stereum hirsutum FP-91666 SS1]EIM89214.1 hypothetical protein STEHIDRAFT_138244 [Stereum hirsutum FP-91666 SS1]
MDKSRTNSVEPKSQSSVHNRAGYIPNNVWPGLSLENHVILSRTDEWPTIDDVWDRLLTDGQDRYSSLRQRSQELVHSLQVKEARYIPFCLASRCMAGIGQKLFLLDQWDHRPANIRYPLVPLSEVLNASALPENASMSPNRHSAYQRLGTGGEVKRAVEIGPTPKRYSSHFHEYFFNLAAELCRTRRRVSSTSSTWLLTSIMVADCSSGIDLTSRRAYKTRHPFKVENLTLLFTRSDTGAHTWLRAATRMKES